MRPMRFLIVLVLAVLAQLAVCGCFGFRRPAAWLFLPSALLFAALCGAFG